MSTARPRATQIGSAANEAPTGGSRRRANQAFVCAILGMLCFFVPWVATALHLPLEHGLAQVALLGPGFVGVALGIAAMVLAGLRRPDEFCLGLTAIVLGLLSSLMAWGALNEGMFD